MRVFLVMGYSGDHCPDHLWSIWSTRELAQKEAERMAGVDDYYRYYVSMASVDVARNNPVGEIADALN